MKFNERVLEEANFSVNPPLERLKFISIFSSNLDEFYMIRVGSLTDYMLYAPGYYDNKTGQTAEEQLDAIFRQTAPLYALQARENKINEIHIQNDIKLFQKVFFMFGEAKRKIKALTT